MKRHVLMMVLALTAVVGACTTRTVQEPATVSPGPALVVERFLQAANANDLVTMMQLFGSASRTIDELDGRAQAERRMYVLASVLRHDDYSIRTHEVVPGRMNQATRLQVDLQQGEKETAVPFLLVRRESGGWIIERIAIEELTRGTR